MYACGYRRVLVELVDPDLHRRVQTYLMADLAGYITEHMGQPMTQKEIRQNVTMLAQLGVNPVEQSLRALQWQLSKKN